MSKLHLSLLGLAVLTAVSTPLASALQTDPSAQTAEVKELPVDKTIELNGSLVPSKADELMLWPEEWSGSLRILEVMPHGSMVERGQVIAVLESRGLEDQLHKAEVALETVQLNLGLDRARAELETVRAAQDFRKSLFALQRAEKDLLGWREFESKHNRIQAELSAMYSNHGIEDAEDELTQLEAMYTADELTDATEEIVLKRSRRNLQRSRVNQDLQEQRRAYQAEFAWKNTGEMKEHAMETAGQNLERLKRQMGLDAEAREHRLKKAMTALQRQEASLDRLRQDMELMEIHAPRAGMLLHGGLQSYHPGQVAPRYERGGQLQARKALFTVAAPQNFEVVFKVPESKLAEMNQLEQGVATVVGLPADAARILGKLEIERFPIPSSASGGENQYLGRLHVGIELADVVPGQRANLEFVPGQE